MSFNAAFAALGPIVGTMAVAGLITCCLRGGETEAEKKVDSLLNLTDEFARRRLRASTEAESKTLSQRFSLVQEDFNRYKGIPERAKAVIDEVGPVDDRSPDADVYRAMHLAADSTAHQFYAQIAVEIERIKKVGTQKDKRAEFDAIKAPFNEFKKKVVGSYERHLTSEDAKLEDGSDDQKLSAIKKKFEDLALAHLYA